MKESANEEASGAGERMGQRKENALASINSKMDDFFFFFFFFFLFLFSLYQAALKRACEEAQVFSNTFNSNSQQTPSQQFSPLLSSPLLGTFFSAERQLLRCTSYTRVTLNCTPRDW